MERLIEEKLSKFHASLLEMACHTEESIHKSLEVLKQGDSSLAKFVFDNDDKIDELENKIEKRGLRLLALFQPVAKDLRYIITGLQISMEMERIGDLAVNIAQRSQEVKGQSLIEWPAGMDSLVDNVRQMVHQAIDAFVKEDVETAKNVILADKKSNELRTEIISALVEKYILPGGPPASLAVSYLLAVRDLERISDHAASIAEDVFYMIDAKMVKHHLEELEDE